jgi:hypothetical protein
LFAIKPTIGNHSVFVRRTTSQHAGLRSAGDGGKVWSQRTRAAKRTRKFTQTRRIHSNVARRKSNHIDHDSARATRGVIG